MVRGVQRWISSEISYCFSQCTPSVMNCQHPLKGKVHSFELYFIPYPQMWMSCCARLFILNSCGRNVYIIGFVHFCAPKNL